MQFDVIDLILHASENERWKQIVMQNAKAKYCLSLGETTFVSIYLAWSENMYSVI